MSLLVTFRLYNAAQQPLTTASPTFTHYLDGSGGSVAAPAISHLGQGVYGFSLDTITAARIFRVDGGSLANPRYHVGGNGEDVQAFGIYGLDGAPANPPSAPTFARYADAAGNPQTAPSIQHPATGLYFFLPSGTDISQGRGYAVNTNAANGQMPSAYAGTVGITIPTTGTANPITTTGPVPANGSQILSDQAIELTLNVTPPALLNPTGRVIIWVEYPQTGANEVIHDGDIFLPAFTGNSRTVDTLSLGQLVSRKFVLARNGGWPSAPKIRVHANTDEGGTN